MNINCAIEETKEIRVLSLALHRKREIKGPYVDFRKYMVHFKKSPTHKIYPYTKTRRTHIWTTLGNLSTSPHGQMFLFLSLY